VIQYRTFRNSDPPGLVEVWNDAFLGRGVTCLRATLLLEYFILAKPYFDPEGLFLACAGTGPVGFALAGFGASEEGDALDHRTGVTCLVGVRHGFRRQGVGTELLHRCEAYLRSRGADDIRAGPVPGLNPFSFALYGGSGSPGFLESDEGTRPFLERRGYQVQNSTLVFQRNLETPLRVADGRFAAYRQRYEIHAGLRPATSWWEEAVFGPVELQEYLLFDTTTGRVAARASVWEMETFRPRWHDPTVGIAELEVEPDLRRQGLAKFLLTKLLQHFQELCFARVEIQAAQENTAVVNLIQGLGFELVDLGHSYALPAGAITNQLSPPTQQGPPL
jgi:ribosomal protein S18 acetylase RimI-like enzyme